MKKIVLFIGLVLITLHAATAQVMYPYSFSKFTAPYNDLTGATNLTAGVSWDDTVMTVPIGFPFKWALSNRTLNDIMIDSYGMLYAPDDLDSNIGFASRIMMAYQADLVDRSYNTNQVAISPISYKTEGTAGNRICKVEFKNAGFYSDATGIDSANFQVWLYEGSNIIEYHYGPQGVDDISTSFDGENGPWINLVYKLSVDTLAATALLDSCSYVAGNTSTSAIMNPTAQLDLNSLPSDFAFDGLPANGQVFRFAPLGVSSVKEVEAAFAGVQVFPTHAVSSVHIQHEGAVTYARLTDLHGKVLWSGEVKSQQMDIPTSSLSQGMYFLSLTTNQQLTKTYKIQR